MMIDKFSELLKSSNRILITTHLGADPDAVCSSLLLYKSLKSNFPHKEVTVAIEELSYGLDFIDSYSKIKHSPLDKAISHFKPELLIILDANNTARCTRDAKLAQELIADTKVAIIDHHLDQDRDASDVYINLGSPAVTEDIYDICFNQLKLNKPDNYAELALIGIYSDTGGLVHLTSSFTKTLDIVNELIAAGANVEKIHNKLNSFSSESLKVLANLLSNTSVYDDFTYSYIPDKDNVEFSFKDIKQAIDNYTNNYVRNIDNRCSGFVVYKDLNGKENDYKVSFRSLPGEHDVAKIAGKLGGGGHKPAAGASIVAKSVEEAINLVKKAISEK